MSADKSCGTLEGRHEILCGYYGLVGHLVDKKKKDEAQTYLKTALALSENYRKCIRTMLGLKRCMPI